jgi:hypothetical protein
MQSVHITTDVVGSNPANGEVSLAEAQYRNILNAVRHGYIFRNIMNILTEYTIYG